MNYKLRTTLLTLSIGIITSNTQLLKAESQVNYAQGNIKVLNIIGDVWLKTKPQTKPTRLKSGMFINEQALLRTSMNAQVALLFDSGAVLKVGPNTDFKIDKYLVENFIATSINYKSLKEEPTSSQTTLTVLKGNIVCVVPRLSKRSIYSIKTPLSVGKIKGTTVNVNVSESLSTFVVTEGSVLVQKESKSYFIEGGATTEGEQSANSTENSPIAVSTDPNQLLPIDLVPTMSQEANDFADSISSMLTLDVMSNSPPQNSPTDSDTTSDDTTKSNTKGTTDTPTDSSTSSLPTNPLPMAPFGGGGGGSGGGPIYSN